MNETRSSLCNARLTYSPKLPFALREGANRVRIEKGHATSPVSNEDQISKLFPVTCGAPVVHMERNDATLSKPLKVGVLLSGGQAPGGHNVISGIFDGVKSIRNDSRVIGFLNGPSGLIDGDFREITSEFLSDFRNVGGFDIIGSGRTKIETDEQFAKCAKTVRSAQLDCVFIIGGDDSNTNAALLAEYFVANDVFCSVIGCPKTIDGDLKNYYIETPFGFDTASKTYAQLIGNIARDANSAKKYWHFIKIMGRSASHIGLEVGLQTQPNICLISEEVESKGMTLAQVVTQFADVVEARATSGKNFGIAIIPEGLLEFIPEFKKLIAELNDGLVELVDELEELPQIHDKVIRICDYLSPKSSNLLADLPSTIQMQLLLERDPHGNVQVSLIETEKLLIELVDNELRHRPSYTGKFKAIAHFFGYEGRCAHPSNFDSDYAYSLGYSASILAKGGFTGYMASISNLADGVDNWQACGIPTSMLMTIERRHGKDKPVIQKALVDLDGKAFLQFKSKRDKWAISESYIYPGSIQYYGPPELSDSVTQTLKIDAQARQIKQLQAK